jgi:hypothetical protein
MDYTDEELRHIEKVKMRLMGVYITIITVYSAMVVYGVIRGLYELWIWR